MDRRWVRPVLVLALGGAAYLTNRFPVPLSFGLHMLLGGAFAMLAAILYGPWAGAAAAAIGALPTLQLWGHPYALLSMTLEAWVVGYEARRGRGHHTETDLLYWLLVGGPLVIITYTLGARIPLMATGVAALKQAVNGLVNTAAASAVLVVLVWWQRGRRQLPLEIFLAHLITALVLVPLAVSQSWVARASGEHLRAQLTAEAVRAGEIVRAVLVAEPRTGGVPDLDWLMGLVRQLNVEVVITDAAGRVVISAWEGVENGTTFAGTPEEVVLFRPPSTASADSASLRRAELQAFVHRTEVPEVGRRIFVRKPLGEVEYLLYRSYLNSFAFTLGLMMLLIAAIRLVAYTVTRPLVQLAALTITAEGAMTNLPPDQPIWVTEVRAVTAHLEAVGMRIKGLVHSLRETQRELERNNVELAIANVHLADEALRDARTGLRNQRAFWQQVQLWVEENHPFTLVLADVQGLAARGHLAAEERLRELASSLQHQAELHGGEVYQYAPDRFACLFPESDAWLAERMAPALPAGAPLTVGAARFPEDGVTGPAVVEAADRRLESGRAGRLE